MIEILWKGKVGYGDIVSPICYAHNISYKLKTDVRLVFRWGHGVGRKVHASDPEQLWVRASYLFSQCQKKDTNVTLVHKFNNPLSVNHINYEWDCVSDDPFHNQWNSHLIHNPASKFIVVNSTINNILSLKEYGKSWKDPIASEWKSVLATIRKKYDVANVDYRTPVEDLCKMLCKATCFIGYHGTAAWVAKFLNIPSIIYSDGGKLTGNSFPAAVIIKKFQGVSHLMDNLPVYIEEARVKIQQTNEQYVSYVPSLKLLRSLCHEV